MSSNERRAGARRARTGEMPGGAWVVGSRAVRMLGGAEAFADRAPVAALTPASPWSVILPFFNEAALLPDTLAGMAAQTRDPLVILVDNGSTDDSGPIAARVCRELGIRHRLLRELRPGKVRALAAGLAIVETPFVATCDADTFYPADYLAAAERLLREPGCVVAGAFYAPRESAPAERARAHRQIARRARLLPRQSHVGGAGQAFLTDALRRAGGFDAGRWNWVLEDHEVIHRVLRWGTMRYADGLWCAPAPRPRARASIRWTVAERLLYSAAAPWAGDWFFYDFLAARLRARQLTSERIRETPFQQLGGGAGAAAYSLC